MGFSFDLRTEYPHGPLSLLMIERVLRWNAIDPTGISQEVGDCILDLVRAGAVDRDFWKWCMSEKSPGSVKGLRKNWAELLFDSVALHTYNADRRSQLLTTSSVLPFWQLSCIPRSCVGHRSLDGFTARSDDAVWREIYPPNGWVCGCSVVPLMASDVAGVPSTIADVSQALRAKCTGWIDIPPKGFPLPV